MGSLQRLSTGFSYSRRLLQKLADKLPRKPVRKLPPNSPHELARELAPDLAPDLPRKRPHEPPNKPSHGPRVTQDPGDLGAPGGARGFQATATESATLARLRFALPLGCLCLALAGPASASPASLAALPAVLLLEATLRSMNPAGDTLSCDPVRGWFLRVGNGVPGACRVEALGDFRRCLVLRICRETVPRSTHHRLFFEDSLAGGDWRRLRRTLRPGEAGV